MMSNGSGSMRRVGAVASGILLATSLWLASSRSSAQPSVATAAASQPTATNPTSAPASAHPERLSVLAFSPVEAGRYLVKITGCNDCHTPAWEESGGAIPESLWRTGVPVGFRGPWGTTYPTNLRLYVRTFTPDTWVQVMRSRSTRPPMPWNSLHAMSDADLRAVFEYIRSLGPAGLQMPAFVLPDEEPKTPFVVMVPQFPGGARPLTPSEHPTIQPTATQPAATGATATPVVQPTTTTATAPVTTK